MTRPLIRADAGKAMDALSPRLTAKAAALGKAQAADRSLEAGHDPRRWRRAGLLWPLFSKG